MFYYVESIVSQTWRLGYELTNTLYMDSQDGVSSIIVRAIDLRLTWTSDSAEVG